MYDPDDPRELCELLDPSRSMSMEEYIRQQSDQLGADDVDSHTGEMTYSAANMAANFRSEFGR